MMGPWLLPPRSTNAYGFGQSLPSCGVKEGCYPPMLVQGSPWGSC